MVRCSICFFLLITLFLNACAAGYSRKGYDPKKLTYDNTNTNCKIAIKNNYDFESVNGIVLGEIKAYDVGLSMHCSEAVVLSTFILDACALGAQLINITKEEQPGYWTSACYRAEAQFIKITDPNIASLIFSDEKYSPEKVNERSELTHKINEASIGAGVGGGLLGGAMVK